MLLNLVNTTGEYLVARLLTLRVGELAAAHPGFNKQAYIGAFSGDYQFWVNVTAFALQAVVASRLVKYAGLAGALLALPLIAFGGYAVMSAGVSFSVVRWIKTAENATDYSIMNTARQMLWLPTSRDEKYKAKQAIDTFFVRGGDVLSAMAVYLGSSVLHLGVQQFAIVNTVLAVVWIGLALTIVRPAVVVRRPALRLRPIGAAAAIVVLHGDPDAGLGAVDPRSGAGRGQGRQGHAAPSLRADRSGAARADLRAARRGVSSPPTVYPFIGSTMDGGGFAAGPAVRARFGDTGALDAHAAWSVKNYRAANANLSLPLVFDSRVRVQVGADWIDAPDVAFYGVGAASTENRQIGLRVSGHDRRRHHVIPAGTVLHHRRRPRRDADGEHDSGPGDIVPDLEPRLPADARLRRTRPAVGRRLHPQRRPLSHRLERLPRDQRGDRQLQSHRCGPPSVHPGIPRQLDHRAPRARIDDIDRARVRTFRSICCRISAGATRSEAISPGGSATATGCC